MGINGDNIDFLNSASKIKKSLWDSMQKNVGIPSVYLARKLGCQVQHLLSNLGEKNNDGI
jgi:hypothetical protein